MNRRLVLACVAVAGTLAVTARLHAQSPWTVGFGAGAAREILYSRFASAQTRLSGSLLSMEALTTRDRKSTRLNSSHGYISYDVFCLKKKKNEPPGTPSTNPIRAAPGIPRRRPTHKVTRPRPANLLTRATPALSQPTRKTATATPQRD